MQSSHPSANGGGEALRASDDDDRTQGTEYMTGLASDHRVG